MKRHIYREFEEAVWLAWFWRGSQFSGACVFRFFFPRPPFFFSPYLLSRSLLFLPTIAMAEKKEYKFQVRPGGTIGADALNIKSATCMLFFRSRGVTSGAETSRKDA